MASESGSILGKTATLTVDTVPYNGKAIGLDSLGLNAATGYTTVPGGRGVMSIQPSNYTTFDFTFIIDSNSTTGAGDASLLFKNGKRVAIVFNDGARAYSFDAILTVALTFDIANDREVYSLQLAVDGAPK